ncbi:hypothetical protein P153DRAFT_356058 [Dothidotthia symphoricarpi CBS 119687]|uniref:Uncharacterized protein n=1 Tax=Dothidotthia symphoricarpi CBS 119687 TaxID=1392245 RepID=A0A6A6AH90_9PLEO|nr:uncharacterized protein P153DRAFT_356058 [Dothidotthia symphoricarpi CBS 119687]KAF2130257.1 hypothetical protein P153DRAFT_356058 [Dothidotthia symphoricarpi CBS 119687]
MQTIPMSPRRSPADLGNAVVQWTRCTRRGRMLVLMALFIVVMLGTMRHHELMHHQALSSKYHTLSSSYGWRQHLPSVHTPFQPSNTTLQLENGEIDRVPTALKKTTPNFHLLIMPSEKDSNDFCKTTLSAMLLNYPPPSAINMHKTFENDFQRDNATLFHIQNYLDNDKLVHDEDLVLIVDGQNSWFQLPSIVMIKQYESVLEDANARLRKKYSTNRFNQTIVFGAMKRCEGGDMACQYAPPNPVAFDLYGKDTDGRVRDMPAKYLSSQTIMGPAKDLRVMYRAAVAKFLGEDGQDQTIQSVFATLFGEQQLGRDAAEKEKGTKLRKFLGVEAKWTGEQRPETTNVTQQHEYSMGLDYTHTLFQPVIYRAQNELVALTHDNTTDLSQYRHPNTLTPHLSLPPALSQAQAPFWRSDPHLHNPSPNDKPAYIDKLDYNLNIDTLPDRHTPWANVPLLQNTYTGAIPAVVLNSPTITHKDTSTINPSWNTMWYSHYKRALLRNYFRTPQSANGYHNSLVGGDRAWDTRGGRGGVWTAEEQTWFPWGEIDGVCGSVSQLQEVFQDNKGVWLHEQEVGNEQARHIQQQEWNRQVEQKRRKDDILDRERKGKSLVDDVERQRMEDIERDAQMASVNEMVGKMGRRWIA